MDSSFFKNNSNLIAEKSILDISKFVMWKKTNRNYNFDVLPKTVILTLNNNVLSRKNKFFYKKTKGIAGLNYIINKKILLCSSFGSGASAIISLLEELRILGVENFIFQLKEDRWMWTDSLRYSRPGCETIGGTSGSPIIRAGTKTVIGVNNTGNEDGQRCAMNNPCEITEAGDVTFNIGYSYGQQTFWVYSCVTATNDIDLTKDGCLLPK